MDSNEEEGMMEKMKMKRDGGKRRLPWHSLLYIHPYNRNGSLYAETHGHDILPYPNYAFTACRNRGIPINESAPEASCLH